MIYGYVPKIWAVRSARSLRDDSMPQICNSAAAKMSSVSVSVPVLKSCIIASSFISYLT